MRGEPLSDWERALDRALEAGPSDLVGEDAMLVQARLDRLQAERDAARDLAARCDRARREAEKEAGALMIAAIKERRDADSMAEWATMWRRLLVPVAVVAFVAGVLAGRWI